MTAALKLHNQKYEYIADHTLESPGDRGGRINRLHLSGGVRLPSTNILMTLNNQIVSLQLYRRSGEYGVTLP